MEIIWYKIIQHRRQLCCSGPLFCLAFLSLLSFLNACQEPPLLSDFTINPTIISVAQKEESMVGFTLSKPAYINLYLTNGSTYVLRTAESERLYPSGHHTFRFSGVVEGYQDVDENYLFNIVQRLVPNGTYQVTIVAQAGQESAELHHEVTIKDNAGTLPEMSALTVDPEVISPNQDGLDDAVKVTLVLEQDVEQLLIYVVSETGQAYHVPEIEGQARPNSQGLHIFHFDALDVVGDELINGMYAISVNVYDRFGQHINWEFPLEVKEVGEIFGFVVDGAVSYSSDMIPLNESLCFNLTVRNSSTAFMRTIGPWPDTVYQDEMNFVSLNYPEDKGVYRIGVDFESSEGQYPFRWALGTPEIDLVQVDGEWYLPPNSDGSVEGCIEFNRIPDINPQFVWIGLLHEQTKAPLVNHRVAPYLFTVSE